MKNFTEFKELVKKKGYGSYQFHHINGEPVYLSRGIREIFLEDEASKQTLLDLVRAFQTSNFGSAVEAGKEEKPGHEYGRYECELFDPCEEDCAVWIHRMEEAIKVYFKFER